MSTTDFIAGVGAVTGLVAVGGTVWLGIFTVKANADADERAEARSVLSGAAGKLAAAEDFATSCAPFITFDGELPTPNEVELAAEYLSGWHDNADLLVTPLHENAETVSLLFGTNHVLSPLYRAAAGAFQNLTLGARNLTLLAKIDPIDFPRVKALADEMLQAVRLLERARTDSRDYSSVASLKLATSTHERKRRLGFRSR